MRIVFEDVFTQAEVAAEMSFMMHQDSRTSHARYVQYNSA